MEFSLSQNFPLHDDYVVLKPLSLRSPVYYCRERASGRHLVIKLFSQRMTEYFFKEMSALIHLNGSCLSPRLYFALEKGPIKILGIEKITGLSLQEGRSIWSNAEKKSIAVSLEETLSKLHTKWQYAHLDLSPKNILAAGEGKNWTITLIDWEASCHLAQHNQADYSNPGTPGFSSVDPHESLEEKDSTALKFCLEFLNPQQSAVRRSLWI